VRTIVAPLASKVEAEVDALSAPLRAIARRYIQRLRLEPYLGAPVERGLLAEVGARRIYFDREDRPDDLFGATRPAARRGDQDPSEGPRWRIVYWVREARHVEVRVVVILAIGEAHPEPSRSSVYERAERQARMIERRPR
jgi:hypothetical protein